MILYLRGDFLLFVEPVFERAFDELERCRGTLGAPIDMVVTQISEANNEDVDGSGECFLCGCQRILGSLESLIAISASHDWILSSTSRCVGSAELRSWLDSHLLSASESVVACGGLGFHPRGGGGPALPTAAAPI